MSWEGFFYSNIYAIIHNYKYYRGISALSNLHLGEKLKDIRSAKGLSVRKLAALSGITASMLSQIENEQTNPSINTLRTIAQALDTPLYSLFQEEKIENLVVRSNERMTIGFKNGPDVCYELLTPDTKGSIEFCMMVIPPGLSSYKETKSHEGEEVAYMISGEEVNLEIEGHFYNLHPGDSVRIPPRCRHAWHNKGKTDVHVVFAITPPSF